VASESVTSLRALVDLRRYAIGVSILGLGDLGRRQFAGQQRSPLVRLIAHVYGVVEAYRDNGKIKQRNVAQPGREELREELYPRLKRLLGQEVDSETPRDNHTDILDASTWGQVLAVRTPFDQLGLWSGCDRVRGTRPAW